ncbi:MFS transporter [Rothia sp. ZJ1223]|uniref:MFS transporter n=1 Tax=Rothia sp. ZJ1223 TaxID=2811098 RepID=UPI001959A941|nr:MFS transporter [Rothia sp. ZJ1223]MBM7050417.1 MFS transporter [Rothia sp. ZJ1223]
MNHKNKSILSWFGESSGKELFTVASLFTVIHSIEVTTVEFSILRIIPEIIMFLTALVFTKLSHSKNVESTLFQGYALTGASYILIFILYIFGFLSFYSYILLLIFAVAGRAFVNFSRESYIQKVIPSEGIGKHYSLLYRVSTICEIFVPLLAGYIVEKTSGPFGLGLSGVIIFLFGTFPFLYQKSVITEKIETEIRSKASLKNGLQEIKKNTPLLFLTFTTLAFSSITAAYGTGYYILIADIYNLPAELIGLLISLGALSTLAFTYLVENRINKIYNISIFISCLLLPPTLLVTLLPNILNSGHLFFVVIHEILLGAIFVAISISGYTLRSKIIKPEKMQSVTVARSFLGSLTIPITTLFYGFLSFWIGVINSLVLISVLSFLIIPIAAYGYRRSTGAIA